MTGSTAKSLVITVLALALIAVFWLGRGARPGLNLIADPPAVVRLIQPLSELATVRYVVQRVVGLEEQKSPVGSEKILLFVQADVVAGIDLGQLRPEHVTRSGGGAVISLPGARVLRTVIDDKHTRVWDRRITWWTPWVPYNPDLERQARLTAQADAERAAIEMGILRDARRNAEVAIRRLLEGFGITTVTFASGT